MTSSSPASMVDQAERKLLVVAWAIVLGAAIAHRLTLFLLHRTDLAALIVANQVWYIFQYLPREMLRDHLFRAMLLLQQTPPVMNLVMGLALKGLAWPAGVATALIALQSLVSILTAGVLVHLLSVLYPRRVVLWTALGLVFVLSTDLVVLEYNNLGQVFYEPLSMLGTLVLLDALVCLRRSGRLRCAGAAGTATALLVVTRATWYLFPVACLVLVAILAPARRMRAVPFPSRKRSTSASAAPPMKPPWSTRSSACRAAARSPSIRRSAPSSPTSRSGSTWRAASCGAPPGQPTIPTPSPTGASPTCRSRPSPRSTRPRRSIAPRKTPPNASVPWA